MIDNATLLIAIAFSSAALSAALLISWLNAREDNYLINWTAGMALVVVALTIMGLRNGRYDIALQIAAFVPIITGLALIYLGTFEFSTGSRRRRHAFWLWLVAITTMTGTFLLGFSGPGTILLNLWCALFLGLSGSHYWRIRQESPPQMIVSALLFALTSVSFIACAIMLAIDGDLVLTQPPDNWAEQFNSIMALFGMTGLGALALMINQSRVARRHRAEAQTDSLTGLMNRRALFNLFERHEMASGTAVLMFDLDHFKQINDQQGHGAGDAVIRHFAQVMQHSTEKHDTIARIGGEEFCAILPQMTLEQARDVAERVRSRFADHPARLGAETFPATVSAGVAITQAGDVFSTVLSRADAALYAAKRGGRNRVTSGTPRHAA